MMLPLWFWPAIALACILVLAEVDCRRINRQRDHLRAIEAERIARANAAPLGNAERVPLEHVRAAIATYDLIRDITTETERTA